MANYAISLTNFQLLPLLKGLNLVAFESDPNAVHLTVRGELVEPPASQLEPFDKLRANGIFLK